MLGVVDWQCELHDDVIGVVAVAVLTVIEWFWKARIPGHTGCLSWSRRHDLNLGDGLGSQAHRMVEMGRTIDGRRL